MPVARTITPQRKRAPNVSPDVGSPTHRAILRGEGDHFTSVAADDHRPVVLNGRCACRHRLPGLCAQRIFPSPPIAYRWWSCDPTYAVPSSPIAGDEKHLRRVLTRQKQRAVRSRHIHSLPLAKTIPPQGAGTAPVSTSPSVSRRKRIPPVVVSPKKRCASEPTKSSFRAPAEARVRAFAQVDAVAHLTSGVQSEELARQATRPRWCRRRAPRGRLQSDRRYRSSKRA